MGIVTILEARADHMRRPRDNSWRNCGRLHFAFGQRCKLHSFAGKAFTSGAKARRGPDSSYERRGDSAGGGLLSIKAESAATIDEEISEVLLQKPAYLEPLAYAVLSYVLDEKGRFALLKDSHYEKIQPAGRRLRWGAAP